MNPHLTNAGSARRRVALAAGLLFVHGVVLWLAMPPVNWWPLAFVSLVPVAIAARLLEGLGKRHVALATLGLLPFWFAVHLWAIPVTVAGYAPFCLLVAAVSGLGLWFAAMLGKSAHRLPRTLGFALAWTGADFFRGEIAFDGYPWGFASHPLIEWWPAAAPGALGGVYFATFLLALLAGGVVELVHGGRRAGLIAVAAAAAGWGAGLIAVGATSNSGREVRVAVLQTNVPQDNKLKWTIETQLDCWREIRAMVLSAPETNPSFVVWPETMMPGFTISPEACDVLTENGVVFKTQDGHELPATLFRNDLLALQRETNLPMLVGDEAVEGLRVEDTGKGLEFPADHRFNSVFLVDGGRVGERYDKMHLTPFGEVMPYLNQWPWLQQQLLDIGAHGMSFDLSPGRRRTVLRTRDAQGGDAVRIATPICFESTDASIVRNLVFAKGERRADLIAFVTNDGWFGEYDGTRLQHLQAARWRCLELATPGVRAANTGLSAAIDSRGRVVRSGTDEAPGASRVSGVLNVTTALATGSTVYARIGDLWGWVCLVACPVLTIAAKRMARGRARDTVDDAAGAAGGPRP